MTLTVGELYETIRNESGRGHTIDGLLPPSCQSAVLWAERNRNLEYMRDWRYFFANPFATDPTLVTLSGLSAGKTDITSRGVKQIGGLAWVEPSTGALLRLEKRNLLDTYITTDATETGIATKYSTNGSRVYLSAIPDKQYMGLAEVWHFSTWPNDDPDEDTHPLITIGEDFIRYHVLMSLSPFMRNPGFMSMTKTLRDDALAALQLAQDAADWEGATSLEYVGEVSGVLEPTISEPRLSQVPAAALPYVPDQDELVP